MTFFDTNTVGQEPWERRGSKDAQLASLLTRIAALEGEVGGNRYFSLVGKMANQGLVSGAVTTINFDTVLAEDQAFFNNAANTWTIPEAGLWEMHLHVTYVSDVNTTVDSCAIWNIDGVLIEGTRGARPSGSGTGTYAYYAQPLNAGSVVTPQGFIVASNCTIYGDGGSGHAQRYTRAMIRRLGPT